MIATVDKNPYLPYCRQESVAVILETVVAVAVLSMHEARSRGSSSANNNNVAFYWKHYSVGKSLSCGGESHHTVQAVVVCNRFESI